MGVTTINARPRHSPNTHALATCWCGLALKFTRKALLTHPHHTLHITTSTHRPNTPGDAASKATTFLLTFQLHCCDGRVGAQSSTERLQHSVSNLLKPFVSVSAINARTHEERHRPNTHALTTCWCKPVPTSTRKTLLIQTHHTKPHLLADHIRIHTDTSPIHVKTLTN